MKEGFPDMPREDRQLLMLRFVREVDQSVDYAEVSISLTASALAARVQIRHSTYCVVVWMS